MFACRPDQLRQSLRLFSHHTLALARESIAAASFGIGVAFFDEPLTEQPLDGAVQRAGTELQGPGGELGDILHDPVPMSGTIQKPDEHVEFNACGNHQYIDERYINERYLSTLAEAVWPVSGRLSLAERFENPEEAVPILSLEIPKG